MNDRIVIAHAYSGFTYLPLFLAHEMGYFPKGVELVYAEGDEIAMRAVLNMGNAKNLASHFAVCDPLLIDNLGMFIGGREHGPIQRPVVFGSLVKAPPIWLFNPNPKIQPVAEEEHLRHRITKVRCYERPNTGFIVGHRLLRKLDLPADEDHLVEVGFDEEFGTPIDTSEVVVTSNILRMGEVGFNSGNIVFSYASKPNDLQGMFFTGLITREEIFATDLPLVLAVLAGLRKAIHQINHGDPVTISRVAFKTLKAKMNELKFTPFETADEQKQQQIVTSALSVIRDEKLYSEDLEVSKVAWDTSISLRRPHIETWVDPPYDAYTNEIPVILLRDDWQHRISIRKDGGEQPDGALAGETEALLPTGPLTEVMATPVPVALGPTPPVLALPDGDDGLRPIRRYTELWGMLANLLFLMVAGKQVYVGLTLQTGSTLDGNRWLAIFAAVMTVLAFGTFGILCHRLWEHDDKNYDKLVMYWLGFLAAASTAVFAIKT